MGSSSLWFLFSVEICVYHFFLFTFTSSLCWFHHRLFLLVTAIYHASVRLLSKWKKIVDNSIIFGEFRFSMKKTQLLLFEYNLVIDWVWKCSEPRAKWKRNCLRTFHFVVFFSVRFHCAVAIYSLTRAHFG